MAHPAKRIVSPRLLKAICSHEKKDKTLASSQVFMKLTLRDQMTTGVKEPAPNFQEITIDSTNFQI